MYSILLKTPKNRGILNRKLDFTIERCLGRKKKSAEYEIPREINTVNVEN